MIKSPRTGKWAVKVTNEAGEILFFNAWRKDRERAVSEARAWAAGKKTWKRNVVKASMSDRVDAAVACVRAAHEDDNRGSSLTTMELVSLVAEALGEKLTDAQLATVLKNAVKAGRLIKTSNYRYDKQPHRDGWGHSLFGGAGVCKRTFNEYRLPS